MGLERDERRASWLTLALWVETASLLWILTEALVSGLAAARAGSLALSAFSADSAIEFLSGLVLWFRLGWEARRPAAAGVARVERVAAGVVAGCLFTLAGLIAFHAGQALALRPAWVPSPLGLGIAVATSLVTPWLAIVKRRLGRKLHSHALLGDAACSMTCACMAWSLLAGLLLQWAFGWWWADVAAAILIVGFVLREAWESGLSAWTGAPHVHETAEGPVARSEPQGRA